MFQWLASRLSTQLISNHYILGCYNLVSCKLWAVDNHWDCYLYRQTNNASFKIILCCFEILIYLHLIFIGFTPNNPKMTQSYSVSQLFFGKNMFFEKKPQFFGNKTVGQRSGANLKKHVFCRNLLQISCFFSFFAVKSLKMTIWTSFWSAQHPTLVKIYNKLLIF